MATLVDPAQLAGKRNETSKSHLHTSGYMEGADEWVSATLSFLTSLFPQARQPPIMSQTPQISQRLLQFRKRPVVYRLTAAAAAAAAQRQLSHRNNSLLARGLTTPYFCNDAGKWKVVNVCLCAGKPLQIAVTALPTGQDRCLWQINWTIHTNHRRLSEKMSSNIRW